MKYSTYGVTAKVLDCGLKVSKFEFHLHYYNHFQTNTFWKGLNQLIPSAMG